MTYSSLAELTALPGFRGMMASFGRLKQDGVGPRSHLYPDLSLEQILEKWNNRVGDFGIFTELEVSERGKAGPYLIEGWPKWESKLDDYYSRKDIDEELLMQSYQLARHQYNWKTRPTTIEEAYSSARKSTNLGLPLFTTKWSKSNLSRYLERARQLREGNSQLYPFVLFTRPAAVPSGGEPKMRCVWGADHAETFAGLTVLKPSLESLRSRPGFAAWRGPDFVDMEVEGYLRAYPYAISCDFSRFDASLQPIVVHTVLQWILESTDSSRLLEPLVEYYVNGRIATPSGVKDGTHGLPSGVSLTNLVDTLANVLAFCACKITGAIPEHASLCAHGDDAVIFQADPPNLADIAESMSRLGFTLSEDKTSVGEGVCHYLQREHNSGYGHGVMSSNRVLSRCVFYERNISLDTLSLEGRDAETLRTVMRLENCKHHPNFHDLIDFVREGDKYALDVRPILNVSDEVIEQLRGYTPDSDRGERDGILGLSTIQYLLR